MPTTQMVASKATANAAAQFLRQWTFGPSSPASALGSKAKMDDQPTNTFTLYNREEKRFLQHEEQTYGINLGWTDDASARTAKRVRRWFMTKKDGAGTPVHYGDVVALANGKDPSFIRYESRTFGINLGWSNTPVFEWKILGGAKGTPVTTGAYVALYNIAAKECMIAFDRTVGGDIGWPSSETWSEQIYGSMSEFLKDHWKEGLTLLVAL